MLSRGSAGISSQYVASKASLKTPTRTEGMEMFVDSKMRAGHSIFSEGVRKGFRNIDLVVGRM